MRRLFASILLMMAFATLAFTQGNSGNSNRGGRGDHDDDGPIQVGYGVVTPIAVTTSGTLVVFETFGLRHGSETTQAGVIPSGMTTSAIMFVQSSGRLSRNLGVAIVNAGSSSVNVTMTLSNEEGTQLGTAVVPVPARQQVSKFVTELFSDQSVPSDVTGTLSITSTDPVSMIGLRFRGANFSTLPVTSLVATSASVPTIATGVGGPGAILLPQFAAGGGWATEIAIVNTSSSAATVRVDLFKADGTPLSTALNGQTGSSFTDLSIPGGGVLTLAPRNSEGDSDF